MACSNCLDCKVAAGTSVNQPASSLSSRVSLDSVPQGPASPHSQTVSLASSVSSSSSSSDHSSSSSDSLPYSKSPAEPGTPGSLSSQKTDEGWEIQQRSKRPAPSEKQGGDSSYGTVNQPRACRTIIAPHPALAAAWQSAPGSSPGSQKPLIKDVLVHHVHATPANSEVLHLASGPVSFQPPPPPPPPRTRATKADTGVVKVQHGAAGNAWNVPGKISTHTSGVHGSAWASAVHQVCVVCIVRARPYMLSNRIALECNAFGCMSINMIAWQLGSYSICQLQTNLFLQCLSPCPSGVWCCSLCKSSCCILTSLACRRTYSLHICHCLSGPAGQWYERQPCTSYAQPGQACHSSS